MPGFDGRGSRSFGRGRGLGPCRQGIRRNPYGFFGNRFNFVKGQTYNNQENIDNIDKQEQKRILKMEIQELEEEKKYLAKQLENLEKN